MENLALSHVRNSSRHISVMYAFLLQFVLFAYPYQVDRHIQVRWTHLVCSRSQAAVVSNGGKQIFFFLFTNPAITSNAFGENISRNATTHNIVFRVNTCVYLYTNDINHGLIHRFHIMPNAYKLREQKSCQLKLHFVNIFNQKCHVKTMFPQCIRRLKTCIFFQQCFIRHQHEEQEAYTPFILLVRVSFCKKFKAEVSCKTKFPQYMKRKMRIRTQRNLRILYSETMFHPPLLL